MKRKSGFVVTTTPVSLRPNEVKVESLFAKLRMFREKLSAEDWQVLMEIEKYFLGYTLGELEAHE